MKSIFVLLTALFTTACVAQAAPPVYVCWDGTLVKNPRKCPVYKPPVVCPDGTVVGMPAECPPKIICLDGSPSRDGVCPPLPVPDPVVAE